MIGIICGTGLSSLGDIVEDKDSIPYEKIKHFPKSTGILSEISKKHQFYTMESFEKWLMMHKQKEPFV